MKPVDPRLITRIGPARRYIIITAGLGFVTAVTMTVQALVIARLLGPVLAPTPLDADGLRGLASLVPVAARSLNVGVPILIGVVAIRVAVVWVQERLAHRAGTHVISVLRESVVAHATTLGPRWIASGRGAEVVTTVTRGLDALLPYFVRYLPQLVLACTVTPLMLVVVLGLDWLSAVVVAVTVPLIPVFMVLVGMMTTVRSAAHLAAMENLGARVLDLIAGVPTLRALGRHRGPAARVRELGDAARRATMGSLRLAFVSGLVLELITTLSVAIVAVTLGYRLIDGYVSIETALAVLILTPEIYLPLRNVGTHFHASADGLAAADAAFAVLNEPAHQVGTAGGTVADLRGASLHLEGVGVAVPASELPAVNSPASAPLDEGTRFAPYQLSAIAQAGAITVLRGPNGEGKSTALAVLGGLLSPDAGRVSAHTLTGVVNLSQADAHAWVEQIAWVPQRPQLGPAGRTLSLGQRHLVAYERALSSGRPVLLLDEPTAHLDGEARRELIRRIEAAARDGATVVTATHDPAVIAVADAVFDVRASA